MKKRITVGIVQVFRPALAGPRWPGSRSRLEEPCTFLGWLSGGAKRNRPAPGPWAACGSAQMERGRDRCCKPRRLDGGRGARLGVDGKGERSLGWGTGHCVAGAGKDRHQ